MACLLLTNSSNYIPYSIIQSPFPHGPPPLTIKCSFASYSIAF